MLANDLVRFEQPGPELQIKLKKILLKIDNFCIWSFHIFPLFYQWDHSILPFSKRETILLTSDLLPLKEYPFILYNICFTCDLCKYFVGCDSLMELELHVME